MTPAQTRLDKAIVAAEQADAEVERLCDIVERAADALGKARETKRAAQRELDEAARAAKAAGSASPRHHEGAGGTTATSSPGALASRPLYSGRDERSGGGAPANGRREEAEQRTDEPQSDYSDEESDEYSGSESEESDEEDEDDDDEEGDGFEMGNEALEQIRYRLDTAKIDPNSPDGTKILDELLVRLQNSNEDVIDARIVNIFIDELLFETEDQESPKDVANGGSAPPPQNPQMHPRIRINRGGKVLGWYQGQLDERGYAREGQGSMYYDAGHECHGTWENDEMVGRGIYQWSDGHVYDGEWLNGKRHGLGRFVRPDDVVLYGRYEKGHHKGEGVRWSADRREAQVVVDGVPKKNVSLAVAKKIATDLGFEDVLPPV